VMKGVKQCIPWCWHITTACWKSKSTVLLESSHMIRNDQSGHGKFIMDTIYPASPYFIQY